MADTAFYQRMADTALRLIAAKGRTDLVLKREQPGAYDPSEDTEVPGTTLEQPLNCIVLPASKGTVEAFDNRLVNGTLIESNLRFMKVAAKGLTFEPEAGDTVELEGSVWTVLGSTPLSPAGIPLVYNMSIQRGG